MITGPRCAARRARLLAAALAACCTLSPLPARAAGAAADPGVPVGAVIERLSPSLVLIEVVTPEFEDGRARKEVETGSGAIISAEGDVVTNYHVAGRALAVRCTLSDGTKLDARVVGADPLSDIAVLRLLPEGAAPLRLTPARFGDSDALAAGDRVLALGSPLALSRSATLGIVSNLTMTIPELFWPFKFTVESEEVGSLVRWIGHDARIFPGNSGGPLVNMAGEIVGINEMELGLSGAIPGNLVREVTAEILRGGAVRRGWIGVDVQPLLRGSGRTRGALVASVDPGGPAERAGIAPGDVILSVDGRPTDVRLPEQLPDFNRAIFAAPVGGQVSVAYERGGEARTATVGVVLRGQARALEVEVPEWGMSASDLSEREAQERHLPGTAGVLVRSVRPGRGAGNAHPPLREGDVLTAVDGAAVADLRALREATARMPAAAAPRMTLVALRRGVEELLAAVPVGVPEAAGGGANVRKAWCAAKTQVLTRELAERLGLAAPGGVRVTEVTPGSAAAAAGLRVGDLLLAVDGERINASRPEDQEVFAAMLRRRRPGDTVALSARRDGAAVTLPVALELSPAAERDVRLWRDEALEFTAREVTFEDRQAGHWPAETAGAVVSEVAPGGWAAVAQLAVGDLVLRAQDRPVPDVAALEAVLREAAAGRARSVTLFVRRGVHTLFVAIEPQWELTDGKGGAR
jgi:serine protease Do